MAVLSRNSRPKIDKDVNSAATRMSLVPCRNEFFVLQKTRSHKCTRMYISELPRMASLKNVHPCTFFSFEFSWWKTRYCLEPLTSCQYSDVSVICNIHAANYLASFTKINFCETSFLIYPPAIHGGTEPKLASKNWQGCQFSSDTDVAGSMQKRVFCSTKNSQSQMYKDVHFRTAKDGIAKKCTSLYIF